MSKYGNYGDRKLETSAFVSKLPFEHAFIVWRRGEGRGEVNSVDKHGGWTLDTNLLDLNPHLRPNWQSEQFVTSKGNTFVAAATRQLVFAPIRRRVRWVANDYGSTSSQMHLLVQVAIKVKADNPNGFVFQPWMPAVLTLSGTMTREMDNALKEWQDYTADLRAPHEVPYQLFYTAYGTFGDYNPKTFQNGGYITPVYCYKPDPMTDKVLESLFVGEEIANQMFELHDLAEDWAREWDDNGGDKANSGDQSFGTTTQSTAKDKPMDIPF